MQQADKTIEREVFSKETYHLVSNFRCGSDDQSKYCENWLKGAPPDQCAFQSIDQHGTNVWLYLIDDQLIGYGSLGRNKADGKTIAFIPMLAVCSEFQGKKIGDIKLSNWILNDLLKEASKLELPLICLFVSESNTRAISLYSKFGFCSFAKAKFGNIRMCKSIKDGYTSII